jgi:hypothetical protein
MEQSIENLKKRDSEYVLKTRFSAIRALLTSLFRINKIEKNKGIRISPDLAYLEIIKNKRYIVKN